MKALKKVLFLFLSIGILFGVFYVYHVHFDYRFTEIKEGKVYRSSVIPADKIVNYLTDNKIKTVIDLRIGNVVAPLNPSSTSIIEQERKAVEAIEGVKYMNIPSDQIPTKENLDQFYSLLDNEDAYPVLIHCHHGTGRAVLYSALYRVEYDNHTPEEARLKTRIPVALSSFDNGTRKGEWLKGYTKRSKEISKEVAIIQK